MSNDNPQRPPAISADFPFAVRDVQVHGARMAYIDEGEEATKTSELFR